MSVLMLKFDGIMAMLIRVLYVRKDKRESVVAFKSFIYFVAGLSLLLSSPSIAENNSRAFNDWEVRETIINEVPIVLANTVLSDGQSLMAMCFTSKCFPMVNLNLTCEKDGEYPVMVSSDDGIYPFQASCFILNDESYFFEFPSGVMDIYARSNSFGIAYGLGSGKFRASYFSLKGSTKAILYAKERLSELEAVREPEKSEPSGYSEQL